MKKTLLCLSLASVFALAACGGTNPPEQEPNLREPYAGTYSFSRFQIQYKTDYQGDFVDWTGTEDEAFAELAAYFSKEEALAAAEQQSYVLRADGSATWNLPNFLGNEPISANTAASGEWDIRLADNGSPMISYSFKYSGKTYSGGGFKYFTDREFVNTLTMRVDGTSPDYEFRGIVPGTKDTVTDNYWQILLHYARNDTTGTAD